MIFLTSSNSLSNLSSIYFWTFCSLSWHWVSRVETLSCKATSLILYKTTVHAARATKIKDRITTNIVRVQLMKEFRASGTPLFPEPFIFTGQDAEAFAPCLLSAIIFVGTRFFLLSSYIQMRKQQLTEWFLAPRKKYWVYPNSSWKQEVMKCSLSSTNTYPPSSLCLGFRQVIVPIILVKQCFLFYFHDFNNI